MREQAQNNLHLLIETNSSEETCQRMLEESTNEVREQAQNSLDLQIKTKINEETC